MCSRARWWGHECEKDSLLVNTEDEAITSIWNESRKASWWRCYQTSLEE